jgi:hypothetical protein
MVMSLLWLLISPRVLVVSGVLTRVTCPYRWSDGVLTRDTDLSTWSVGVLTRVTDLTACSGRWLK